MTRQIKIPEDVPVCDVCSLPMEGEFVDMCGGHKGYPFEGWVHAGATDHYHRKTVGRYEWGLKGLCHRSGVVPDDTQLWESPEGSGCIFCKAILKHETKSVAKEQASKKMEETE
jgi:hypothetical protein